MRFDEPVYFVKDLPGQYNAQTGDYDDGDTQEVFRYANITDAGETTMNLVYGRIKQGALVIRIQGGLPGPFDYIRIGTKRFRADRVRQLRRLSVFVVSEVQT